MTKSPFNSHLETCEQCQTQPFGMCVTGRELLILEASGSGSTEAESESPAETTTCQKRAYPDKKAAITAANERTDGHRYQRGRRHNRNQPKYLRPYFCDACQAWHLTSRRIYSPQ